MFITDVLEVCAGSKCAPDCRRGGFRRISNELKAAGDSIAIVMEGFATRWSDDDVDMCMMEKRSGEYEER